MLSHHSLPPVRERQQLDVRIQCPASQLCRCGCFGLWKRSKNDAVQNVIYHILCAEMIPKPMQIYVQLVQYKVPDLDIRGLTWLTVVYNI